MKVFQKVIQSIRLFAQAFLLSLVIVTLQIRIRRCNYRLWVTRHDPHIIHNLKDERFGYQIEAQSLSVRVHRLMAARKLKEQSALERFKEWKG